MIYQHTEFAIETPSTNEPAPTPANTSPRWSRAWRGAVTARLEDAAQAPLTALAIIMAPVVLAPYAIDLAPAADQVLIVLGYLLWAVFAVNVAIQLLLNPNRTSWLSRHWLDVAITIAPMIRPLHAARTLRMWWAIAAGARGLLGVRRLLSSRRLIYILGTAGIVVSIAADLVLEAEKANPDASIHTFGDALWWAVTTVTSVGYGDKYPTTPTGRGIGIALMVLGIALFGVVTANLAGLLIEAEENRLEQQLGDVDARLRRIEDALGKQATRQRAIADRAMRMARRNRTRTRKDKEKDTRERENADRQDRPGKDRDKDAERQAKDAGRQTKVDGRQAKDAERKVKDAERQAKDAERQNRERVKAADRAGSDPGHDLAANAQASAETTSATAPATPAATAMNGASSARKDRAGRAGQPGSEARSIAPAVPTRPIGRERRVVRKHAAAPGGTPHDGMAAGTDTAVNPAAPGRTRAHDAPETAPEPRDTPDAPNTPTFA